jgi:opacity protein-like surface antigen
MKLRSFALAGVALAVLSSPAMAGSGWYLGVGAGLSSMDPVRYSHATPAFSGSVKQGTSAVFAGAVGYKFDGMFRLENEIGYSSHDAKTAGVTGSTQVKTDMFNIIADIGIYSDWKLSLGAGLGAGSVRESVLIAPFTLYPGYAAS